jgi:type I restriction enzyme S subunit
MSFPQYSTYKGSGSDILGAVPAHWNVAPIKRIARLTYGDALPGEVRNDNGTVPVYGSNGPVGVHDNANTTGPVIIVGRKGSYGAINWSENPAFAIDTAYYVDKTCTIGNLRWLFWALQTANLGSISQDTGVPGLARELQQTAG